MAKKAQANWSDDYMNVLISVYENPLAAAAVQHASESEAWTRIDRILYNVTHSSNRADLFENPAISWRWPIT
jgi:hypothetical protein